MSLSKWQTFLFLCLTSHCGLVSSLLLFFLLCNPTSTPFSVCFCPNLFWCMDTRRQGRMLAQLNFLPHLMKYYRGAHWGKDEVWIFLHWKLWETCWGLVREDEAWEGHREKWRVDPKVFSVGLTLKHDISGAISRMLGTPCTPNSLCQKAKLHIIFVLSHNLETQLLFSLTQKICFCWWILLLRDIFRISPRPLGVEFLSKTFFLEGQMERKRRRRRSGGGILWHKGAGKTETNWPWRKCRKERKREGRRVWKLLGQRFYTRTMAGS